ncbi:hypothetical protein JW796_00220 [Candidatus Dojkabacteria bacterium]|nr:hypothetical protein [Candidatus Dojkabacteria bacterium]
MKYFYLVIFGLILAFFEATVGSVSPFGYINYLFIAAVIIFWLFGQTEAIVLTFVSGIIIDLLGGDWIGTKELACFAGLLIVVLINSIFDLQSEGRRFFGALVHLVFTLLFNYFLIIFKDNAIGSFSHSSLIYTIAANIILFSIVWIIASSSLVKKTSLYR